MNPVTWIVLLLGLLSGFTVYGANSANTSQTIQRLIQHGEQQRQQGHLRQANTAFTQALTLARQRSDRKAEALSSGLLGYTLFQQQHYKTAEPLLKQAWQASLENNWPNLATLHANYLGNYYLHQRALENAELFYHKSLKWALKADDKASAIQARLNLARLAQRQSKPEQAWDSLQQISTTLTDITLPNDRARLSLQTGYQTLNLKLSNTTHSLKRIRITYQALTNAHSLAKKNDDTRTQSLALGYLGQLYESQQRYQDALIYANQAVNSAQRIQAQELLLQWEWLRGRLLKAQKQPRPAIDAYRRAVHTIQAIRQDIPVDYYQGRSSFRETLEPVYLGLADLLLQQAEQPNTVEAQTLLKEARQTVELIKKTELEDYFNNRCDIQTLPEIKLEQIAPKAATLYPILLPERLGLLVSIDESLYFHSVPVAAAQVRSSARTLAKQLRARRHSYKKEAQQLYQWLIEPINALLQSHAIDTLVVIPDGALRLIPFAALWDGKQHLIERYATVTSPGLSLFDPKPLPRHKMTTLLAGLSMPGPVIKTLPAPMLYKLLKSVTQTREHRTIEENTQRDISSLLPTREINDVSDDAPINESQIQNWLNDPAILKKAQQKLALPGVKQEIQQLSAALPATTLLNETFISQRLDQEIKATTPYRIVHIASHGVFGHSSEQSFIMAYDQILTLDTMERLLLAGQSDQSPIELLTLSACQTAEGDDRSPLGLSGIALKAKVRSVLGSLWPVPDKATTQLMKTFYSKLSNTQITKAQALQHTQLELLKKRKYKHPYYWSAFILVGNWL